jgi:hypothetical protein
MCLAPDDHVMKSVKVVLLINLKLDLLCFNFFVTEWMAKTNEDELKLIYPLLNNFKLKAENSYPYMPINGIAHKSGPKSWVQHQRFQIDRHLSAAEDKVDNRAYPLLTYQTSSASCAKYIFTS